MAITTIPDSAEVAAAKQAQIDSQAKTESLRARLMVLNEDLDVDQVRLKALEKEYQEALEGVIAETVTDEDAAAIKAEFTALREKVGTDSDMAVAMLSSLDKSKKVQQRTSLDLELAYKRALKAHAVSQETKINNALNKALGDYGALVMLRDGSANGLRYAMDLKAISAENAAILQFKDINEEFRGR
jgi:hypothetical protein